MLKVGVTGGIGSGKSLICNVFSTLGAPVFNADTAAKNILDSDTDVIKKITSLVGEDIYKNNLLDRRKLADIIFNNSDVLNTINSIVHPKVREAFITWCMQYKHLPYVIQEAAILFESGAYKMLDFTINVHASEEIRLERVMQRDNILAEKVKERMKNQMSDDAKMKLADITIYNDNNIMILPQILEVHKKLLQLNK